MKYIENLTIGQEYYTYYFTFSNKLDKITVYAGVMKIKAITYLSVYKGIEIIKSKKLAKTIESRVLSAAYLPIFDNEEDCIAEHDQKIIEFSKNRTTENTELILSKLINKNNIIKKPKIEIDSINWYNSLTSDEQQMVKWLKHYYSKI